MNIRILYPSVSSDRFHLARVQMIAEIREQGKTVLSTCKPMMPRLSLSVILRYIISISDQTKCKKKDFLIDIITRALEAAEAAETLDPADPVTETPLGEAEETSPQDALEEQPEADES